MFAKITFFVKRTTKYFLIIRNCTTSYIFSPFFCLDTKRNKKSRL